MSRSELGNTEKHQDDLAAISNNYGNHRVFLMSQVCRLQDLVRKSEQGLGTAEGHISSLQEAQEILQKELELTRARLRETTDSLYSVEVTMLLENKL